MYLPAIVGIVHDDIITTMSAFLDFCYLVRRYTITASTLDQIKASLDHFHQFRQIFIAKGIRDNFSLPRQHAMVHYPTMIPLFAAPSGLCSSITENKHIYAVKETWRRSNRNDPLGQMITANQRLSKLIASRADFERRGMLDDSLAEASWRALRDVLRKNMSESDTDDAEKIPTSTRGEHRHLRGVLLAGAADDTEDFFDDIVGNHELNEIADLDNSESLVDGPQCGAVHGIRHAERQIRVGGRNDPLSLILMASKQREYYLLLVVTRAFGAAQLTSLMLSLQSPVRCTLNSSTLLQR